MSKVNANPQLGFNDDVPELKRTLANILREHAQIINGVSDGSIDASQNGTAAPTSQSWKQGDFIKNSAPAGATPTIGWICTVSGTPGTWVAVTVGGGGAGTNLTATYAATTVTIESDTGTDVVVAQAGANAGVMSGADKTKLDGIAAGATVNSSDAFLLARANHTGTQLAATVSDFDTQVRTSRLDQMAAPSASVNFSSQQATNFRIENRTSDPGAPSVGQIWLRTDL